MNHTITHFYLEHNSIGDKGAIRLAEALKVAHSKYILLYSRALKYMSANNSNVLSYLSYTPFF